MSVRVAKTRHGAQIFFDSDVYFAPLIERCGEYNEAEVDLFRQLIGEGSTVVDAGANIGCHTLALARIVGPSGRVLAFEPQRPVYYALCGSIALNQMWQVTAYQAALGDVPGTAKMPDIDYTEPANYGGVSIAEKGYDVPVVPLDAFDLPALRFIKVDVEGHETEVLLGARETIRRHRPILYVENDRAENSDRLINTLLGFEYRLYLHAPPLFSPDNFRGCQDNPFPNVVSVMLLGVPAETPDGITGLQPITRPEDMVKFVPFVI